MPRFLPDVDRAHRLAALRAAVPLLAGAMLGSWAFWDLLHPHPAPGYFHLLIARDADCVNAQPFEIQVTQLPFRLDLSTLGASLDARKACYIGWNRPGPKMVWSRMRRATLLLDLPPTARTLHLSASVSLFAPRHNHGDFALFADGRRIFRANDLTRGQVVPISVDFSAAKQPLALSFVTDAIDSPYRLGQSADPRQLGVLLQDLTIR